MRDITVYHANVTLTSMDAAYVIVTNMTCMGSMCGCVVMVGSYLMYPDIRTTARTLVVLLGCANFLQCVAGVLQAATYYQTLLFPDERKFLCESAASSYVIGQVSSALWTCAVTVYLFLSVSLGVTVLAKKLVLVSCVFCFSMPVLLAAAAGFSDVYGYDVTDILYFDHPAVCWISDRVANMTEWCFLTVEGWVIATYFLTLTLFVAISCSVHCQTAAKRLARQRRGSSEDIGEDSALETSIRQLRFVPFIYCFLRVWGTGHFLFTEYPTKRNLRAFDWLLVIRAFGDNSQGLANCVLFCCTTVKIRRMVVGRTRKLCACCTTWWRKQHRRLKEEHWVPQPIVRMSRTLGGKRTGFELIGGGRGKPKQSLDGSFVDISNISLELPPAAEGEELQNLKNTDEEVLFERH